MRYQNFILLTAVLVLAAVPARAGEVVVTGYAVRHVTPDIVNWTINVNTDNPDLIAAKQDNDRRFQAALAVTGRMAATPEDIETGPVWIDRQYTRNEYGGIRAFSHFSVRRTIKVRQRDLTRFEVTMNELINSAEVELHFAYAVSAEDSLRSELRLEALDVARAKAEAMATRLGQKLGRAISISEFAPATNEFRSFRGMGAPPPYPAPEPTSPEKRSIGENVYVTFEMK